MHKSALTFGLLLSSLVMLVLVPFLNQQQQNNFLNSAMAQEYDKYGDSSYSQYPTDDKKYECRTGPFEGFFVSSVEFCKYVKFDDKKDRDTQVGPPGPTGPQGERGFNGTQGLQGPPGQNATEVTVNNIRDPVTNQTLQCVLNTNVDPASIDCVLPPTPEPPTCEGCFSILSEQDLEGFLEIFDQTIDSVTGQEIDINTLEDLCEFLETSTLISSSEKFQLLSTTLGSQGISDEDEQIILQCLKDLGTVL